MNASRVLFSIQMERVVLTPILVLVLVLVLASMLLAQEKRHRVAVHHRGYKEIGNEEWEYDLLRDDSCRETFVLEALDTRHNERVY